jgi:competence protein ComEA
MMKKREGILSKFMWPAALVIVIAVPMSLNAAGPQTKPQAAALVDLNTASQEEITSLKGIGPATAKKIIAGRPYKSVDELSKAGLSAKKIDAIRPFVTVGPASEQPAPMPPAPAKKAAPAVSPQKPAQQAAPVSGAQNPAPSTVKLAPGQKVNINTADAETLQALPGIGPVKAQAIIAGRPYEKIEDITKVKGIKQGVFNKIKDSITVK